MFEISRTDIETVLRDYNIHSAITEITELQRYNYECKAPDSKEVRLIIKVERNDASPLVIRFKNEVDVSPDLIESQCRFAETMRQNGIDTPIQYQTDGKFARWYHIGGYAVIVTVEQFVKNQLKVVTPSIARKTGELLAKMHTLSERNDLHVNNPVLFDPFSENDLFAYDDFVALGDSLDGNCKELFDRIVGCYADYMTLLSPLKESPRYAVQGDISDCNLYHAPSGEIGIFDFNRCGDNVLFCDAAMQAVFESRLMFYPENADEDFKSEVYAAFWAGYCSLRPVTEQEQQCYPYLYAIIDAFWSQDICWRDDSLINVHEAGDTEAVQKWLNVIWERLSSPADSHLLRQS